MSCNQIVELTQSTLALVVVIGGGLAALTGSTHTVEIMPFVALIFGFYFGKTVQNAVNNGKDISPNG